MVVRPLLWPVFMDFFRKNYVGPQQYPLEGIGDLALMVIAWCVVVLATASMVKVSQKLQTLSLRALKFHTFWGIDSYIDCT